MNYSGLIAGSKTAFIDKNIPSDIADRPQLVLNNYKEGQKVIATIESELLSCTSFQISVAFITMGGITPLLQTFKELESKGVQGQILTTDYLKFSDPKALRILASFSNIQLKMYHVSGNEGFHTKGYIFLKDETYRIIIGSSNMTLSALTSNHEWNTKLVSTTQGEYADHVLTAFHELWHSDAAVCFEDFIEDYEANYKKQIPAAPPKVELKPNKMQMRFIESLKSIYKQGHDRALLISATGTGKTYASAFATKAFGFRKVLFLVHRQQIAKQAMASYRNVFPSGLSMGLLTGHKQNYDADFTFATIQTLSKDDVLNRYSKDYFDLIIIDEAHHSSAMMYQKVMDYFTPQLWLGMTATPDKRDDHLEGRNIYEIFHHQIAYEIRLNHAMEENMLCPFHYFGISDIEMIDDHKEDLDSFRFLTSKERVNHIMHQANYYGYSGKRVKGLIFCSRIDEAKLLSEAFNEQGWRTLVLSGSDSESKRSEAIERLAMDEPKDPLDYILTVDIFSEGVDVPEINQVIMLRPTQSPIVFIQQLGRGLRKSPDKEYVVILDFIGNYQNNFMIPIALSGDRSYNKDNVRRYLIEGMRVIPGASTIHFDPISRKRIFDSIDRANFSDIKLIKEAYSQLKNKLGHIPSLMDFDTYGEMDVLRIFDNPTLGSYYRFLVKYEPSYTIRLNAQEEQVITFISKKLGSGKRVHELELLKRLIHYETSVFAYLERHLKNTYNIDMDGACRDNIVNVLTNEFPVSAAKKTFDHCVFLTPNGDDYCIDENFKALLSNPEFVSILEELLDFGIHRYQKQYKNTYQNTNLVLNQKYTYEDACRLLNWERNEVPLNIGGYKYDAKTKTFPVFINYDKQEDISDTIKYEDHFVSENRLIAISKSGRSIQSEDVQNFLKAKERGISVPLFVRKNKADKGSKEFYYLGGMVATGNVREIKMPNTDKTAVEIEWLLETPVREDLYEYIVRG